MMYCLLHLSIIIIVLIRICLTQELNELNICDNQTTIITKNAFHSRFQNRFVAFLKLDETDTVYVIKVNQFQPKVSNNQFELSSNKSVELWTDWDVSAKTGKIHSEITNFKDVFVLEDRTYLAVVYLNDRHYFRAFYDSNFSRIADNQNTGIENSGDSLIVEINTRFGVIDGKYLTSMRFPEDTALPNRAFVYLKSNNTSDEEYKVAVFREIRFHEWIIDSESNENTEVVSVFYITNYTTVDANKKQFYIMEITSNGRFRVKKITLSTQPKHKNTTKYIKKVVYRGDIKQLFDCQPIPTQSPPEDATTDISNTFDDSFEKSITTTVQSLETTSKRTTDANKNIAIYILASIILLSFFAAIIVLMWCCCYRNNKKPEQNVTQENGLEGSDKKSQTTAENDKSIRSEIIVSSDNQSDSADNPSGGVSPQTQTPKDGNALK